MSRNVQGLTCGQSSSSCELDETTYSMILAENWTDYQASINELLYKQVLSAPHYFLPSVLLSRIKKWMFGRVTPSPYFEITLSLRMMVITRYVSLAIADAVENGKYASIHGFKKNDKPILRL